MVSAYEYFNSYRVPIIKLLVMGLENLWVSHSPIVFKLRPPFLACETVATANLCRISAQSKLEKIL